MSYSNLKAIIALLEKAKKSLDIKAVFDEDGLCYFEDDMKQAEVDIHTANYFLHQLVNDEESNFNIISNTARYNCVFLDEIIKGLEITPFGFECVMTPLNSVITNLKNLVLEIEKGV